MLTHEPAKYLFEIGNFKAASYGFMLFLSFALGYLLTLWEGHRKNINLNHISGAVLMAMLGAAVGARVGYLLEHLDELAMRPALFLEFQQGGLSSIGGIVGATFFIVAYLGFQKLPISNYLDTMVPGLCLGVVLTRIGCFMNGCCYGIASSLPWAVDAGDFPRHPTQLYHSLSGVILFVIIWKLRKKQSLTGLLFPVFLLIYAPLRFAIEYLRDSQRYFFDLTAAQLYIVPLYLAATLFIYFRIQKERRKT